MQHSAHAMQPRDALPERLRLEFDSIDCGEELARFGRARRGGVMWRDQRNKRFCFYTWEQFEAMAPNIIDAESVSDVRASRQVALEHGGEAFVFCWLVPSEYALRVPFYGPVFRSECVSWVYVRPRRRSSRLLVAEAKRQRHDSDSGVA